MQKVYHYHEEADGKVTEKWTLGQYDATATSKAHMADEQGVSVQLDQGRAEQERAWRQSHKQRLSKVASSPAAADSDMPRFAGSRTRHEDGRGGKDVSQGSAGRAAEAQPPAPPMLHVLDYLPDAKGMSDKYWPFVRQHYSSGDECVLQDIHRKRSTEVRIACSPDSNLHVLVREPDLCTYVYVVYSPTLCTLQRYQPVSKGPAEPTAKSDKPASSTAGSSKPSAIAKHRSSKQGGNSGTAADANAGVDQQPIV